MVCRVLSSVVVETWVECWAVFEYIDIRLGVVAMVCGSFQAFGGRLDEASTCEACLPSTNSSRRKQDRNYSHSQYVIKYGDIVIERMKGGRND